MRFRSFGFAPSGANVIMLWLRGYPIYRYLTFKQALESGGHVRKGEHGTRIYYVSQMDDAVLQSCFHNYDNNLL
jgi:antirestriction protein ArdC